MFLWLNLEEEQPQRNHISAMLHFNGSFHMCGCIFQSNYMTIWMFLCAHVKYVKVQVQSH